MAKSSFIEDLYFNMFSKPIDKNSLIRNYVLYMFDRTNQMFRYKNLPDTIKERDLEYLVQSVGFGCALMFEGKPYVLRGSIAGMYNEQYLPTKMIVTNPYLNLSREYTIGEDCVWFRNDSMWRGLSPLHNKYSTLLAECDISIKFASINTRLLNFVSASDDVTKLSAESILKDIEDGNKLGIIATRPMLDSFKVYPAGTTSNSYITQLIELRQYLYGNWYIELGLNANYNMKRETLTSSEIGINEETLMPLIDDMERERKDAIEQMNRMFGLSIEVERNSSWFNIKKENELIVDKMEAEVEAEKANAEQGKENEDEDKDKGVDGE